MGFIHQIDGYPHRFTQRTDLSNHWRYRYWSYHLKHDELQTSAIATYHNNPAFIAGNVAALLNKKLTLAETRHSKAPTVAIDIYTIEGNVAYGKHLYEESGASPWSVSSKCWSNGDTLAMNKVN